MTDAELLSLQQLIAWATFWVTFALGIVMRRSGFCAMGAVADLVVMRDGTRLRIWLAAIGVAILGTQGLAALGLIDLSQALYTGPRLRPASHLIGGVLFGFGMVLASGCASRNLVRLAGGNLKSLVVLITLGLFASMSLRGVFGALRVASVDRWAIELGQSQDLPTLLSGPLALSPELARSLGLLMGAAVLIGALSAREVRRVGPLLTALLVGSASVAVWWISGHLGHIPEHPETLAAAFVGSQSGRMESLSYVAPIAFTLDWLMFWSEQAQPVSLGVASVLGLWSGALTDTLLARRFRWEGFQGVGDTAHHLIGAALMGVGGVTALGCTIGQGLSGLSTLAVGSMLTFLGLLAGGAAGVRWQSWRVSQMH